MMVTIHAKSDTPLSFRGGRNTSDTTTLPYIPGGALLGCLAGAHNIMRHNPAQFTRFFLQDSSGFGNLYPASVKNASLQNNQLPVYPMPATARTCKRFKGFQFDAEKTHDHHGGQDQLLHWALFELSGQSNIQTLNRDRLCTYLLDSGQACNEPIDYFGGFYRRGENDRQWGSLQNRELLRTHTGINRATGTVAQGILYSRSVLAENSEFWGTIWHADETAAELQAFIQEASAAGLLRIGNNRTRGLGKISLKVEEIQPDTPDALAKRIKAFNDRLRQMAKIDEIETPHNLYVPLTLTSDVILYDHFLRHQKHITPAYLAQAWDIAGAALIYGNTHIRHVVGWNDLWRLPKADDLAIGMGSVFLFGFTQPLDDDLLQKLFQLQRQGIGSRRKEGFGQLLIANPFHWEVNKV